MLIDSKINFISANIESIECSSESYSDPDKTWPVTDGFACSSIAQKWSKVSKLLSQDQTYKDGFDMATAAINLSDFGAKIDSQELP